ncbi:S41 family peptidase [Tunicatimonas pelagia]|uniref:S41 family peptidase n=1 Tax=Tunicatimonas pelagia TaxID=931531 RepID=UPI002666986C|nr:S41 family peptidase [Tunicatimonas pelagia]WKN42087.1 S41 family peptidase [Tunicatimonas pelagia]
MLTPLKLLSYLFCLIIFHTTHTYAQEHGYLDKKFTTQQLLEDFTIFRQSLEESHPGLYWFNTKAEMDRCFDQHLTAINHPMTEREFFPILSELTAQVGCLHTTIAPSELTGEVYFTDSLRYFPLDLKILDGKGYVYRNVSEVESIPPGAEIVSINETPMDSIITHLLTHTSSDGHQKGWAAYFLQSVFHVRYKYLIDDSDQFRLVVKEPNGSLADYQMVGLSYPQRDSIRDERYGATANEEPWIQLRIDKAVSTATLRIPRFANWEIDGKKYKFKQVLARSMSEILEAEVDNLILDVGDRGGGNEDYGLSLLSYFLSEPFAGYKGIEFKNKKLDSRKYSEVGWLRYKLFRTMTKFEETDSTYLLKRAAGYKRVLSTIRPAPEQFTGKVFLLVGRSTASATSDFAAWMRSLDLATIIGEETGGNYYGNTSNWEFNITLPNTKIRLLLPLARYLTNVKPDIPLGRGVIPDHLISPTIEDFLQDRDPQHDYAMRLIEQEAQ